LTTGTVAHDVNDIQIPKILHERKQKCIQLILKLLTGLNKKAVLSQGETRDAAVNFDTGTFITVYVR